MQNLLRAAYEKILLLTSAGFGECLLLEATGYGLLNLVLAPCLTMTVFLSAE